MSFDLAVWFPHRRLSDEEALETYRALGHRETKLEPHPAIAAFYRDVTALHPEIDDVPEDRIDDHDYCPWSIAHERSDRYIIMCAVWPKAQYVKDLVQRLAGQHGLAVFDPQASTIAHPPPPRASGGQRPWWKLW